MSPEDEADLRRLLLKAWNRISAECVGKQGFQSRNQAANAMHGRSIRSEAQAYRCSCCGLFHVGTRKKCKPGRSANVEVRRGPTTEGETK